MQQAKHNDAALTLLSLFGQCSLQDVDGDKEEGEDITDRLTWGDEDDHMNEAEFEEAEM
jgi:acyl-CoA-binding protein